MNSIERLDKKKRQVCRDLSIKDQLKTGYQTRGQLERGLTAFAAETNKTGDFERIFPDTRIKIRLGTKGEGDYINLSSFVFDDNDSDISYDSPPLSAVAEEEQVGMELQQLIALYETGRLTPEEFSAGVQAQQERVREYEYAETGERRTSLIRPRIREPAPIFQPRQPIATLQRDDSTEQPSTPQVQEETTRLNI